MKRNIQFIIPFIFITYNFNLLFAQDHVVEINSGYSNGQHQFQDMPMSFGADIVAPTPAVGPVDSRHWWKIFGYERLNSLVELALAENYHLEIAQSQVDESKARVQLARSSLYPSLSFNPSFFRQEFSGNRPLPFEVSAERIRYNTYSLPLDLSYEVDIFGKVKNRIEASQLNLEASSALQQASRLDVASAVAKHFVLLLTLDSEDKILDRTRVAREENLEIVKTRYQAGLTNEIDLQRAKTELSSVAVQLKNIQIERRKVELMLATLCGQTATHFSIETSGIKYSIPMISPDDSASQSLRPDLQAATYAVEAFNKQVKSVRKNRYPSLYIAGSTGLLAAASDHIFEGDSRNWLLGATLSVPLFEGGRRQARLDISEQQLQRSISQLKQEELVASQEVERAKSNLLRLNEQLIAQEEFLEAAQRAAALSHQRYRKGLVTYLEVVDAERIVLEAERLSIQLLGQQLLSTVDFIVARGGER